MILAFKHAQLNKSASIISLKKISFRVGVVTASVVLLPSCLSHDKDLNEIYSKTPTTSIPTPSEPSPNQPPTNGEPEASRSGVQAISLGAFGKTGIIRDFDVTDNAKVIPLRVDQASQLLPVLNATVSKQSTIDDKADFDSTTIETEFNVPVAGGALPLTYTSVYRDFKDMLRIGHTNGNIDASSVGYGTVPIDSVVVVGNATQLDNMPTEGQAKYDGVSTYRMLGLDSSIQYGTSEFDVDFVNKSVVGTLTAGPGFNIDDGVISGNQLTGTNIQGGFYGSDAKLLGGIYETDMGHGTFGATKQ